MCSKIFIKIHAVELYAKGYLEPSCEICAFKVDRRRDPPQKKKLFHKFTCIKEVAHDPAHDHIDHVAHWQCVPSPMCPIHQGAPSLSSVLTMIPICPCVPLPICQKICQVVKKMSNCQKDVKCQKVKHIDYGGGS